MIEVAGLVVAGQRKVGRAAGRDRAPSSGDDPAGRLDHHCLTLAHAADRSRHETAVPERDVQPQRHEGCRAVHGDVGHVRVAHGPVAVLHRAHLAGVARLAPDRDIVWVARGGGAGEREAPVGGHGHVRPEVREHQPGALKAVDRAADRERGRRRRRRRVIVKDRHGSVALLAERAALGVRQGNGEVLL